MKQPGDDSRTSLRASPTSSAGPVGSRDPTLEHSIHEVARTIPMEQSTASAPRIASSRRASSVRFPPRRQTPLWYLSRVRGANERGDAPAPRQGEGDDVSADLACTAEYENLHGRSR
jgi:hypothetical protein